MKQTFSFTWLFPLAFLFAAGCDSEYRADSGSTSVYVRTSDSPNTDIHTLVGGVEVVNDIDGLPVSDSEISIDILGDGQVQDRFTVVTGPLGVARFEIDIASAFRPFETLAFRVRHPFHVSLADSVPITQTAVIAEGNGFFTTLYEADVVVSLSPR